VLTHRLIQALLLGVLAAATFSMSFSIVEAAEDCRPKPDSTALSGSRWIYRINRGDHRHCWFLSSKARVTHSHLAQRYRHLAADPGAVQQKQQRDTDLQTASAPTDKPHFASTVPPPAASQAPDPPAEQSSDNLVPRSVPTVAYRLPPARAQIVTEPTILALPAQTVTPIAANRSNVVLLAGAAAVGLLFAVGIFHFTGRVHRELRRHVVADGDCVREPVGVEPLVDAMPLPMTTDLVEDVDQALRNPKRTRPENLPLSNETRDDTAVFLPHAAAWLSRPKAKPRMRASYELADA
jgi:hypothetical protein